MPYKKSAVSSSQIVQSAVRVLAKKGYARTSLQDIANEAGMSKGAVHYHFATKEALIGAALTHATDAVQARTLEAFAESEATTPAELVRYGLAELWKARIERSDEAVVVADLIAQSFYDDALRPRIAEFFERAANQSGPRLQIAAEALGLEPRIPFALIPRVALALLDGLVLQAWVDPDAFDGDEVVQAMETIARAVFNLPDGDASNDSEG